MTKRKKSLFISHQFINHVLIFSSKQRGVSFLLFISVVYFAAVTFWDWQFRRSYGFSFGIQGRYFFPVIVAHMALLMIGISSFVSFVYQKLFSRFPIKTCNAVLSGMTMLVIWWIILHSIALWTVATSYYDVSSWQSFVIQASQYKPWIFKGGWWIVWIFATVGSTAMFAINYVSSNRRE
jgi:hypothetical protein